MWPIIHMQIWDKGNKRLESSWDWEEEEHKGDIPVFYLRHLIHRPKGADRLSGINHEPLMAVARIDKFTPLLNQTFVTGEPLSDVILKWYRVNYYAQEEHFYTHTLEDALVVGINVEMDMQFIHFKYRAINWRHETAAIEAEDCDRIIEKKLKSTRGQFLRDWRDYEEAQKRRAAIKAKKSKANEQSREKQKAAARGETPEQTKAEEKTPALSDGIPRRGVEKLRNNMDKVSQPANRIAKRALNKIDNNQPLTMNEKRKMSEALGEIGGEQASIRQRINPDKRFENRAQGADLIGVQDGKMIEQENKGNRGKSTALSRNKDDICQLSDDMNAIRAKGFRKKCTGKKKKNLGKPSKRIGGAYTKEELDLYEEIADNEGEKKKISVHTDATNGETRVFERNKDGDLGKQLDSFNIYE